ncbi:MAG: hypothetical protein JAZ05_05405 [Candidatus Thiodiazotropha taylori]|nr:hypothetical protein [Candidatus Thiodiazotropha taylori]
MQCLTIVRMGYAFRRMLSDPQGVGIINCLDDLFRLLNRPGRFASDMQQISMPAPLCQLQRIRDQLSDCAIGIDSVSASVVDVAISISVETLVLYGKSMP